MLKGLLIANRGEISCPSILPELVSGRGTARRSRGVEGRALCCDMQDVCHHGVEIAQDIARGDPERLDVMRRQNRIPPFIALRPIAKFMRHAINFDAQANLGAVEIKDIGTGRMLATKLQSIRSRSQLRPQSDFGQAQLAAKSARAFYGLARFAQHRPRPSTMLCMVPLTKPSLGKI